MFFWLGKDFPVVLLVQSFVMVGLQLLMVRTCVNALAPHKKKDSTEKSSKWDMAHFWNWDDFATYGKVHTVQFLSSFALGLFLLTACLQSRALYFEVLGFLSLGVEATLGIPQFYKNLKRQSTEGLSLSMIVGWTVGDSLKTIYFILRDVPSQFLLCGGLQICVDLAILAQFASYTTKSRDYLPY